MTSWTILLPPRRHVLETPWLARRLARADTLAPQVPGRLAQLGACFRTGTPRLPVAALRREYLCADAGADTWVCADPANVLIELNGGRLMACGTLDLDADEAQQLARALRPALGDRGLLLEITEPARWHLRLPPGAPVPVFDDPEDALGDDLLAHLPPGDAGRRWRAVFTEAQVILHNHAVNAARIERGAQPINALWFHGAGALPDHVRSDYSHVFSDDVLARALARRADIELRDLAAFVPERGAARIMLDHARNAEPAALIGMIETHWKRGDEIMLAFADGARLRLTPWQRFAFWRRGG